MEMDIPMLPVPVLTQPGMSPCHGSAELGFVIHTHRELGEGISCPAWKAQVKHKVLLMALSLGSDEGMRAGLSQDPWAALVPVGNDEISQGYKEIRK